MNRNTRTRLFRGALASAVATLAAAGATPFALAQSSSAPPAAAATAAPAQKVPAYTRAEKAADGTTTGIQTAIRTFAPASGDGPTVHLVAVTHIGEAEYYRDLQTFLDRQTVVLFEGIKVAAGDVPPSPPATAAPTPAAPAAKANGEQGSTVALQTRLSRALGVRFQLEAVDYRRAHFRNSDLTWKEMERLAGQSGAGTTEQLSQMKTLLSGGGGAAGSPLAMVASLLGQVETNPAVAQMFRRVLVTALADPEAMAKIQATAAAASANPPKDGAAAAAPPKPTPGQLNNILIAERNKAVVKDLSATLPKLGRGSSVALFYGAAHMADMEQRLVKELGYREAADAPPRWLTALKASKSPDATATPAAAP